MIFNETTIHKRLAQFKRDDICFLYHLLNHVNYVFEINICIIFVIEKEQQKYQF